MPIKKAAKKKNEKQSAPSLFEYLRFGESYTSLILGILAVIIATVLLLSFIHGKQSLKPEQQTKQAMQITGEIKLRPISPTSSQILTATSTARETDTPRPTQESTVTKTQMDKTYTVVQGDSLWAIAEKTYNDGDRWVEIAKANKLVNPSDIHAGNKLILPRVSPQPTKVITPTAKPTVISTPTPKAMATHDMKITGDTYKIAKGDDLWDIAVRAYGDGYAWTKIAKANNLTNPGVIHVGNTIKIPRK